MESVDGKMPRPRLGPPRSLTHFGRYLAPGVTAGASAVAVKNNCAADYVHTSFSAPAPTMQSRGFTAGEEFVQP